MKTILTNNTYKRVDNDVADYEVKVGNAKFAPKSEWKTNVRNVAKTEKIAVASVKGQETKNKKAEKSAKLKNKQRPAEYTDKMFR
jgi:hypothetical protein